MRLLSIRRKLLVACGAIALLTGALGGGALWAVLAVSRTYETLARESLWPASWRRWRRTG